MKKTIEQVNIELIDNLQEQVDLLAEKILILEKIIKLLTENGTKN